MPLSSSRLTQRGCAALIRLLLSTSLVSCMAGPVLAQGAEVAAAGFTGLGGAVAGGTGLRGSANAIDAEVVPDDQPDLTGLNSTTSQSTQELARKVNLPPLRGTALPERYPVQLPPLAAYPRSLRIRKGLGEDPDQLPDSPPAPSVAALAVPSRKTILPDENPFGPVGYEVGTTRVFPYVEQDFGYDSNPEQVSTGVKGSAFSRTEGGFTVQSDWSAHELKGTIHGGYDDFFSNSRANRPDAAGVMDLRIDATRDTKFDAEGRFAIDTQRPGSPELDVAVRGRPLITSFGATAGITQAFGRFSVGLHALFDRTAYENGELTDGTAVPLDYDNFNDYGVKARLGYDLKPGLQPFVEVGYDRRVRDQTVDPAATGTTRTASALASAHRSSSGRS